MRALKIPNIQYEEWILAALFVMGFILIPNPIGRKFLLLQQPIMAGGIILLSLRTFKKKGLCISWDWVTLIFAVFIGLQFLSALWAYHPAKVWKVACAWLMLFLFYLNIRSLDISTFSRVFWRGLVQVILGINLLLITWFLFQVGYGDDGFQYAPNQMEKIYSYFSKNDNGISSMIFLLLLVLFYLKGPSFRFLTYSMLAIGVGFMFLINSKVPILTLLALGIIYIVKYAPREKRPKLIGTVFLLLAIIICFVLLFSDNSLAFFTGLDPSRSFRIETGDDRLLMWGRSIRLWQAHPLLGIGSGNWMTEYLQYGIGDFNQFKSYIHSHNLIFETLAELGTIGVTLILGLILLPLFSIFSKSSKGIPRILYAILFTFLTLSSYYGVAYCINGRFAVVQYMWIGALAIWSAYSQTQSRSSQIGKAILLLAFICFCWQGFYVYKILTYKAYRIALAQQDFQKGDALYEQLYSPYVFEFILNKHIPGIHGQTLMLSKQYEKAAKYLEISTLASPFEYPNWFSLGTCYLKLGKNKQAIQALDASLRLNPKDVTCAYQLAEVSFLEKDWKHFDTGISVYYTFLLPQIEEKFEEDTWFPPDPTGNNYGNKMCSLQDQFILLIDKKDRLFQSESNIE